MSSINQKTSGGFHPFLQALIDGPEKTTLKNLEALVDVLRGLDQVFRSNAEEVLHLVELTGTLVKESKQMGYDSNDAIKSLLSRVDRIDAAMMNVKSLIEDVKETLKENSENFKSLKRVLTDFPSMLSQLKKMLAALDSRLAKPLEVRVELPAQEGAELTSTWNTLLVDVVGRNFQGNIETVRIKKET